MGAAGNAFLSFPDHEVLAAPGRLPYLWKVHGRLAIPPLRLTLACVVVIGLATPFLIVAGSRTPPRRAGAAAASTAPVISPVPSPLAFEPASGRFGHGVRFVTRRGGYALGLMRDGSTVLLAGRARLTTRLVGARRDISSRGEALLPGKVNSYIGNDRRQWRIGLPTYGAVRYANAYPGIDLRYHGREGQLEYDYVLRPGADPARIAMTMTGGRALRLTPGGDLVIRTAGGPLRQRRPVA